MEIGGNLLTAIVIVCVAICVIILIWRISRD
jgi:hypothetical protein